MKLNTCKNDGNSESRNYPNSLRSSPVVEAEPDPDPEEVVGKEKEADLLPPYVNEALDQLLSHPDTEPPNFMWGDCLNGSLFCELINKGYDEAIHWRRNIFMLPHGKVAKAFVQELADLLQAFAQKSTYEGIALKASFLMQILLLQKPFAKSKAKDHVSHLSRRLASWKRGDIDVLLEEGRCIQAHLSNAARSERDNISRVFARMMFEGNVQGAINFLVRKSTGAPMKLDDLVSSGEGSSKTVLDVLHSLHPDAKAVELESLLEEKMDNALPVDPVIFGSINADMIKDIVLLCKGSAGPSGVDALAWRRMCSSFKDASNSLCEAIAGVARRLSTNRVSPSSIEALLSCRLVPLNKNPGVRPIGVGEVMRRVIGKAILKVVKKDVMAAAGPLQVCSGIPSGGEAAVHAVRDTFEQTEAEGVLLIDAINAFNSLNRKVALLNMKFVCPALETILVNCYQSPVRLFVSGGGEILSKEGTTQGDPLGMAMFALSMVPLIKKLKEKCESAMQVWFADDASGVGTLVSLKRWWSCLVEMGPLFGYHPNAAKTCLVVKEEKEEEAKHVFQDTDIVITTEGKRHLGAAIGSSSFVETFVSNKVEEWKEEIEKLSSVAGSQPHAAYAAFVHGTKHKWSYISRTVPNCGHLLQPLENAIQQKFIPAISGGPPCSLVERDLLALPTKKGGLDLPNPAATSDFEFEASKLVTAPLVQSIIHQSMSLENDPTQKNPIVPELKKKKSERIKCEAERVYDTLDTSMTRLVQCAIEPGASTWLNALPIEEHGFLLSKGAFRDALCLRYGWPIAGVSSQCACGAPFSVDHAMTCHKGGLPTLRHNEVRDLTAELLSETSHCVSIEPKLQSLHDEEFQFHTANREDGARLDVQASDFWCKGQEAFFDIRVFYPSASSYRQKDLKALYTLHERQKKRAYAERVREVEHGAFTPLVFASTGGMARECLIFIKRIGDLLADKKKIPYSKMMFLIRCRFSFALLRSSIRAIRGSRQLRYTQHDGCDVARALVDGHF